MKVALLGVGWFPTTAGGLDRYVRELHDALVASGVEVTPVVFGPADDVPPRAVVVPPGPFARLRYAAAVHRVAQQVDVVNVHFALQGVLPLLRGDLRRPALVTHFHGPWVAESTMTGEGVTAASVKLVVEQTVYRRSTQLVVLSQAFREQLHGYGVPDRRISTIHPGVDGGRFRPLDAAGRAAVRVDLGLPAGCPLAITVRRLVPRMGLDVLLRAWAADVLPQVPGAHLLVVGDGQQRAELEALATELGIRGSVHVLGRVPEEQLPLLYAASDIAVTPSLALEGWGLVLLEALATGTPVVASDVGGMREALTGQPDSRLVPPGDQERLAQALVQALQRPADAAVRQRCRDHADRFTWRATAAEVTEVYARSLSSRRSSAS